MLRLTIGAVQLPDEIQERHARYVITRQRPDGGWSGREGESDPYYTSFALRCLAVLGLLEGAIAERCTKFLLTRLHGHESIVDLLSIVYSTKLIEAACGLEPLADIHRAWELRLTELLYSLRRSDGGFSKSLEGQAGSTYQTFLALLCLELLGQPLPEEERTATFLLNQRQSDGGFLEIRVAKRSGTNPTAAALGALRILKLLAPEIEKSAANFLLDLQTEEGGYQANTRIPLPDLLSTFTASVSLTDAGELGESDLAAAWKYVSSMELATGGFRGFELDHGDDVEYTFYGLGTFALLNSVE